MTQQSHKFWMVWSPQGRSPTYQHLSRWDADFEARRLAEKNPGCQFFVLKAVHGFQRPTAEALPIVIKGKHPDAEIPF